MLEVILEAEIIDVRCGRTELFTVLVTNKLTVLDTEPIWSLRYMRRHVFAVTATTLYCGSHNYCSGFKLILAIFGALNSSWTLRRAADHTSF